MDSRIIFVYCLFDDLLNTLGHREDPQCRVSDAETLTVALEVGGYKPPYRFLHQHGDFSVQVASCAAFTAASRCSAPCFMSWPAWLMTRTLTPSTSSTASRSPSATTSGFAAVGAIAVRRGDPASQRRDFYGLKIHLMVTAHG